jgi:hypothetical protein
MACASSNCRAALRQGKPRHERSRLFPITLIKTAAVLVVIGVYCLTGIV